MQADASNGAICSEFWSDLPHLILIGEQLAAAAILLLEGRQ
jgi:hypothetical protein